MKTLFGAIALILAAPIAAQSAPAADPHAAHKQGDSHHKHGEKQGMDCCKMACCEKMKQQAGTQKKGCCAEGAKAPADQHKGH
jgi:hypothetical protein